MKAYEEGLVVAVAQPLMSKPWGMREFDSRTIDGHRLMFGQEL